ncbi:nucleotide-diphospho-sugar transferase [Mucilaginibacter calamicampi]|uniref:Nucleotide-diphospho-sugar transferase n=1 Tax=Mucilaginibacter calamicampi TaxID=1302352 RepID=A0ABW2YYF4_9SPHI
MSKSAGHKYQTKSAVLFIVFNRPAETAAVLEKIREARPPRLYIGADGPRANKPGEEELCRQTRENALKVDWDCEVKTLFKDSNVGCKIGEASAMQWFFDNEEEGIILEDDTLPSNSFFMFCDELLEKYRHDTRIRIIAGANFQHGKKWGDGTYYFSNLIHGWGWAGWRRVWNEYDINLNQYDESDVKEKLANIFNDPLVINRWYNIFNGVKSGKHNTWDYQFAFSSFFNHGLCIIPNYNLITNIGFGENATHTKNADDMMSGVPLEEITEIIHPRYIVPEKQADLFTMNNEFHLAAERKNTPFKKFRRKVKALFGFGPKGS